MAIQDDFSVSVTGDIRYTGTTSNYTVIELHRWLGDLMDDAAASGNDILDITDATASERSTDNIITLKSPYNINNVTAQHLYDGSIIQSNGNTIYDGILVFAATGAYLEIIQDGAKLLPNFWTTGLNADTANGISHRFMVMVRNNGADIDNRRLIGQTREFGFTYSEFKINSTSRGNNVMALTYAADLNNQSTAATVSGYSDISNIEGYRALDVDGNLTDEYYYSEWDKGSRTINQFFERIKLLTMRGSNSTLYGFNGELVRGITHEINLTTPYTGTFNATEPVGWGTGAAFGKGIMFATDDTSSPTKMWIQFMQGVAPSGGITVSGITTLATATHTSTPTERTLSFPLCGASTGSALIGSYGFGIDPFDLSASDKLFDLTDTQRNPPNNVTFTVFGLSENAGENRILVGPASGTVLDEDQFTTDATYSGTTVTSIQVSPVIPSDTTVSGTIRLECDSGIYKRIVYTEYSNDIFTIESTNFSSDNSSAGSNCYISYIDTDNTGTSVSFTTVYLSNRDLFIRVRDGGVTPIKTFETTGTLGSAGGSATAILTSDE